MCHVGHGLVHKWVRCVIGHKMWPNVSFALHQVPDPCLVGFSSAVSNYTVSQKTSHLWLAIIFMYMVRLQQFLAQILRRKYAIKMYFIFPPHLTNASALPGETENPEIVSFHLNDACFFTKKHETQFKNITWSELNHPSLSKQSTGCTRQDLGREHSILLSVTHMPCVS